MSLLQGVYEIRLARTQHLVASSATVASSLIARLIGLLRHQRLQPAEALIIPACRSVHTFGMRFAIDVVFVDRAWKVVAVHTMVPGRMSPVVWRAWAALELAADTCRQAGLVVGDQLQVSPRFT